MDGRSGSIKDKLWGKYWAEHGLAVVHVDHVSIDKKDDLKNCIMRVEKLVYQTRNGRQVPAGISCQWVSRSTMEPQKAVFSTRELIPYEVAEKGIEKVNEWLNRFDNASTTS